MIALLRKELIDVFGGWSGWMVIALFYIICTFVLWVIPGNSYLEYGYASTGLLFETASYVLLFILPAITYSVFSTERKHGTMEVLFSMPVRKWQLLISKFLACLMVVVLIIFLCYPAVWVLTELRMIPFDESGQIVGSFIGLFITGGVFIAIGLFMSSITPNPALSFILSVAVSLLFYDVLYRLGSGDASGDFSYFIRRLSIRHHVEYWSQGILSASGVVYLLSLQLLFLGGCHAVLLRMKLRSG